MIETGAKPGEFVSFLVAFLLAYEPAKRLARLNIDLSNNLVGVRVLYEVVDSPPSEPSDDDRPPLKLETARLEFAIVRFGYRPGTPALRGMSFVAQPGKVTALVGPSGGGKSTVLNLILRLYDTDSGRILIDGQDIAAVSPNALDRPAIICANAANARKIGLSDSFARARKNSGARERLRSRFNSAEICASGLAQTESQALLPVGKRDAELLAQPITPEPRILGPCR